MRFATGRFWLAASVAGLLVLFVFVFLWMLVFGWGYNQALTVTYVTENLRSGMTVREVEMALAMPECSVSGRLHSMDRGDRYATVADSGLVGSFFVPQREITLIFDHSLRLTGCEAEIHWRADEYRVRCDVRPPGKDVTQQMPGDQPHDD